MKTLEEAKKWTERYPDQVKIHREVRYFATVNGVSYQLFEDRTLQELEQSIWKKEQQDD